MELEAMFPEQASLGSSRVATEAPSTCLAIGRPAQVSQLQEAISATRTTYIRDVLNMSHTLIYTVTQPHKAYFWIIVWAQYKLIKKGFW